jgi:hypothetical protein
LLHRLRGFVNDKLQVGRSSARIYGDTFLVFDFAGMEAPSPGDWWWLLAITAIVGPLALIRLARS